MNKKSSKTQQNHCKICDKTYKGSTYKFQSHLYKHGLKEPRFKCGLCFKEFYRKDLYNRHIHTHDSTRKLFVCDHCDRGFVDKRNLILHLRVHDDVHLNSIIHFPCTACGVIYSEKRLLIYHIRKNHYNLQNDNKYDINNASSDKHRIEKVKDTNIFVEITNAKDNVLTIKKSDKLMSTENKNEKNNLVKEYMNSVFAIRDKTQYSKAVCDYCKKEMLKKSLKTHIREKHLKIRKFKCEQCKQNFNRHYQMVNHICGKFKRKPRK